MSALRRLLRHGGPRAAGRAARSAGGVALEAPAPLARRGAPRAVAGGGVFLAAVVAARQWSHAEAEEKAVMSYRYGSREALGSIERAPPRWRRLAELAALLVPVLLLWPLKLLHPRTYWDIVARQLDHSGPCFVKLAQWLSCRRDVFSDEFCEALGQLHDTVDAQWSEGVRPEAVQARLNGEGLALRQLDEVSASSGSIAEVFFGELEDGTEVAVKCLRPGIRTLLEGDLRWLLMASRWADHHLPRSGIGKAAEDFAEQVWMQMDFDIESSHLSRFRSNFARSGESIAFPAPLFTAPDLLVLTRERGHNVAHLFRQADEVRKQAASSAAAAQPADGSQASTGKVERQTVRPEHLRQVLGMSDEACQAVAHAGMGCFMRMLFMDCFIHGDMHPGNLILRLKDESEGFVRSPLQRAADWLARLAGRSPWQPFELVVLDAGLAIPMARQKVDALRSLALSIMYQDYSRAADILYSESPDSSQCQDPSAFKMEIAEIFRGSRKDVWDQGYLQIGDAALKALQAVHKHQVGIDTTLTWVLLSMLSVEGASRQFYSEVDATFAAVQYIVTLPNILRELSRDLSWATAKEMLTQRVMEGFGLDYWARRNRESAEYAAWSVNSGLTKPAAAA